MRALYLDNEGSLRSIRVMAVNESRSTKETKEEEKLATGQSAPWSVMISRIGSGARYDGCAKKERAEREEQIPNILNRFQTICLQKEGQEVQEISVWSVSEEVFGRGG